jgi:hypothetical protein
VEFCHGGANQRRNDFIGHLIRRQRSSLEKVLNAPVGEAADCKNAQRRCTSAMQSAKSTVKRHRSCAQIRGRTIFIPSKERRANAKHEQLVHERLLAHAIDDKLSLLAKDTHQCGDLGSAATSANTK